MSFSLKVRSGHNRFAIDFLEHAGHEISDQLPPTCFVSLFAKMITDTYAYQQIKRQTNRHRYTHIHTHTDTSSYENAQTHAQLGSDPFV